MTKNGPILKTKTVLETGECTDHFSNMQKIQIYNVPLRITLWHYDNGETVKGQTYFVSHQFEHIYALSQSALSFVHCTFLPYNVHNRR